jgi:hypothetical protein
MNFDVNEGFVTSFFGENEIVSGQLPTFFEASNNISNEVKTLILAAPFEQVAAEQEQLNKILAACKFSPGTYLLLQEITPWAAIRNAAQIQNVLLFGITEQQLGISIVLPEHQIIAFDERKWVKTLPVAKLLNDGPAKNALWQNALKPLFST